MSTPIALFVATLLVLLSASQAVTANPAMWSSIGVNVDPTNTNGGNATASQLIALGTGWARVEFKDSSATGTISPQSWALYDSIINSYTQRNISVLLIIDYQTLPHNVPWHQTSAGAWASYTQLLAQKALAIASRYLRFGAKIAFEVWNEPDLQQTYVPPVAYGPMLSAISNAIKNEAGNKLAKVLVGGLASGNPQYLVQVEANSPGNYMQCDAVALHPYGQRPSADWPSPTWGFGTIQNLVAMYTKVTRHPFWISEVGTADLTVQGQFPSRFFTAARSLGIEVTIWFCWSDAMVAPFGLLDKSGAQKASYKNYETYSHP